MQITESLYEYSKMVVDAISPTDRALGTLTYVEYVAIETVEQYESENSIS